MAIKILIVEDDNNARKLMETVITQYGYQPVATRDALEALKIPAETPPRTILPRFPFPSPRLKWPTMTAAGRLRLPCLILTEMRLPLPATQVQRP